MARQLRIEFSGAVYHLTSRGNARADIFIDDSDRTLFLSILSQVVKRFNWLCHAYCLMNNHYHLMIETPDGNVSIGMRQLNGVYTQAFNRKHNRDGHLLKGRYKAILVEKESHLLELCRYIVLNPVRAGVAKKPDDFEWSSYLPMIGKKAIPESLSPEWVLVQFSTTVDIARQQYRQFVSEGIGCDESPWDKLTGQIILGSEAFLKKFKDILTMKEDIAEIPRRQRYVNRPPLAEIFKAAGACQRFRENVANMAL